MISLNVVIVFDRERLSQHIVSNEKISNWINDIIQAPHAQYSKEFGLLSTGCHNSLTLGRIEHTDHVIIPAFLFDAIRETDRN